MRPHFQPSIPYTNGLSAHKSPRFLKSGTAICSLSKRVVFYNQPSLSAYHRHQPRYHGISQVFCLTKDITFLCVVNELPVMSEGENEVCEVGVRGLTREGLTRKRNSSFPRACFFPRTLLDFAFKTEKGKTNLVLVLLPKKLVT